MHFTVTVIQALSYGPGNLIFEQRLAEELLSNVS
jgi:hypothetical protein